MDRNELINKAIIFATKHHEGVCRKGKLIPYIIHPMEVMGIISSITDDVDIIAAGALHDLVEDTDVTLDDIKREFNERVASIVAAESQNYLPGYTDDLSWEEVRRLQIEKIKHASIEVKIVALADKLSNIKAIYIDKTKIGSKIWDLFSEKNPHLHKWRFYELLKCFDELNDTFAFKEFEYFVNKTFEDVS